MDNCISFQSKIKFIDSGEFKTLISHRPKEAKNIDFNSAFFRFSPAFSTEAIRTCTGGGMIKKNKGACGFHIYHSEHFNNCIDSIFESAMRNFRPDSALIVGGKKVKGFKFSMPNFNKIKKIITERVQRVSTFEEHQYNLSETSFMYILSEDTWYMTSQSTRKGEHFDVKTLTDLRNMYKKIQIASGDRLFIGEKEILPKDCPEIFQDLKQ